MIARNPRTDRLRTALATPLLAVALLAIAGGVAVWVDSEQVEQLLEAGTVDITVDEVATLPADNLAAGDRFTHHLTVRDHSSLALGGLDLTVDYDGADPLLDDLQVNVAVCRVADGEDFGDCEPRFLVGQETDTLTFEPLRSVHGAALPVDEALGGYDGGDVAVRVAVRVDDTSQAQATAGSLAYTLEAVQRDGIDSQDDRDMAAADLAPATTTQTPAPATFVVGDDDALEGTGVALRDAVQFAPGDIATRYFAVVGADTDRQIRFGAVAHGPLVTHDRGVRVTVAGCDLPAAADLDPARCRSWTEHFSGTLIELDDVEVGAALADQTRMVRLALALPEDAPNALQGEQTTATYTITALDTAYDPRDPADPPTDPPTAPGPDRLPRTGSAVAAALLVALGLLAAGTLATAAARRRAAAPPSDDGGSSSGQRIWILVAALVAVSVGALVVPGAFAQFSGAESTSSINVTTIAEFE